MSAQPQQHRNPYRPGAAIRPLFLAGRDTKQRRCRALLHASPQLPANVWITGLRGVGVHGMHAHASASCERIGRMIEASFTSTPKTVLRSYRACHPYTVAMRWTLIALSVVLGLALRQWWLVIVGAVYALAAHLSVRRQLRPYLAAPREVTLTLTDHEYRVQGADRMTSRTWTTFTKVRRRGGFWVLTISPGAAMAFPVDALTPEQTETFINIMRTHGLTSTPAR